MKRSRTIPQQRQAMHGDFAEASHMTRLLRDGLTSNIGWNRLSSPHREALQMIVFKMARIVCGDPDRVDHWDDLIGYSQLGRAACKGRRR
jgi:hypothetical protein